MISKVIVVKHGVLSTDEYMLLFLVGRNEQIGEIAYLMKPVFRYGTLKNALIFGPTGSGKTAVYREFCKI